MQMGVAFPAPLELAHAQLQSFKSVIQGTFCSEAYVQDV